MILLVSEVWLHIFSVWILGEWFTDYQNSKEYLLALQPTVFVFVRLDFVPREEKQ